ncbi:hypothetical protein GLYMA_14G145251v4 [Glycine max]|nr:hypothetical protein GLYMA_14G145251v4 [Glycine max]KAH1094506.1 hypothetical protein GYH30_039978 [Glycine max]
MILFLVIIITLGSGTDCFSRQPVCFFFVLVIFSILSRSPCFIHNIYEILFSGSAPVPLLLRRLF